MKKKELTQIFIDAVNPETLHLLKITKDAQIKNTKLKKINTKINTKIIS